MHGEIYNSTPASARRQLEERTGNQWTQEKNKRGTSPSEASRAATKMTKKGRLNALRQDLEKSK